MSKHCWYRFPVILLAATFLSGGVLQAQPKGKNKGKAAGAAKAAVPDNPNDARNATTGKSPEPRDPEFAKYGIYEQSAPRPAVKAPVATSLPLELKAGDRIAFIGNTLFERA